MDPYPRDDELKKITEWQIVAFDRDIRALMDYVQNLWMYDDYFIRRGRTYTLHTGGWSGNEDLVGAMQHNLIFWTLCWVSSRRGGHYVFQLPKKGGQTPRSKSTLKPSGQ